MRDREYYLNQDYDYSIAKIHSLFLELSIKEKVIAMKWLVLCLIEKEQYVEAINILKQAVKNSSFIYRSVLFGM